MYLYLVMSLGKCAMDCTVFHPIRSRAVTGQGSLKPAVLRVAKEIVASGDKPPAPAAAAAAAAVEFVLLRSLARGVQSASTIGREIRGRSLNSGANPAIRRGPILWTDDGRSLWLVLSRA